MIELIKFRENIYSQCGEDGILDKIFSTLEINKGKFVEFGGWDGIKYSNCYNLVKNGWNGLYIDNDRGKVSSCIANMKNYENVFTLCSEVSLDPGTRIDEILPKYDIFDDGIDVMSIDIDSWDYWVFASLINYRPKIIIIEVMARNRNIEDIRVKLYKSRKKMGCSLNAMVRLGYYKEYEPIAITQSNVIFIRKEDSEIDGKKIFKTPIAGSAVRYKNGSLMPYNQQKDNLTHTLLSEAELHNSFNDASIVDGSWIINPLFSWEEQYNKMAKSDEIKFTEDELKSLSDLRDTYAAIQNDFGAIKVRKVLLTQQLNTLEETEVQLEARYSETQTTEQELMKSLNEKYGPGNLDPQSGVFTPVSTP